MNKLKPGSRKQSWSCHCNNIFLHPPPLKRSMTLMIGQQASNKHASGSIFYTVNGHSSYSLLSRSVLLSWSFIMSGFASYAMSPIPYHHPMEELISSLIILSITGFNRKDSTIWRLIILNLFFGFFLENRSDWSSSSSDISMCMIIINCNYCYYLDWFISSPPSSFLFWRSYLLNNTNYSTILNCHGEQ